MPRPIQLIAPILPLLLSLLIALSTTFSPALAQTVPEVPAEESAATPPLETLVEVLKDDAARQSLIEELEAQISGNGATPAPAEPLPPSASLGGRLADMSQQTAEVAADAAMRFWSQIVSMPTAFSRVGSGDYAALGRLLFDLALLAVITYGVFVVLRLLAERLRRLLLRRARRGTVIVTLLVGLAIAASNLILVAAAWATGHVVALSFFGHPGFITFHHSAFLNAFLIVEGSQALVRAVLSPRRAELRLVPLGDFDARELTKRLRLLISVLVFGQMLLVPLATRDLSPDAGTAVSVICLAIALALLVNLVLSYRERATARLLAMTGAAPGTGLSFAIQFWHVPVLLYLIGLFVAVLVRPAEDMPAILWGTAQVLLAIIAGIVVSHLLGRLIMGGVKVPPRFAERVPLLEARLNAFVPRALTALRLLVFIVVAGFVLDQLGLFDVAGWLESEFGARLAGATVTVAIILFMAFAAWLTVNSWVDYRFHPDSGRPLKARERTLLILARNALTVAIIVLTTMFVLSEIGINIAPLLASAGVIGLAVGFGAQKLVQDIITGIFIQLEGVMDVGDVVEIAGRSGVVERLTIRSAALRDLHGAYHVIPFSSVDTVTNMMRGFSFAVLDMGVAYRENVDEVHQAMLDAFTELKTTTEPGKDIMGELEWMGVEAFGDSAITVRGRIKTLPGKQWGIKRAYNGILKRIFDERNIEIPFPHQTVYFGVDKQGKAPPLHMVRDGEPDALATPRTAPERPDPAAT
jgi:small-conductance mechanosensitive channel